MTMPGFTAEASLRNGHQQYQVKEFNLENNDGIYPALCGRETFALLLDLCDGTGNATGCYREVLHWCVRQ